MEYTLLTGLGLAAPAGLNAYIPLLVLALSARLSDRVSLDSPYDLLASGPGLTIILLLLTIEITLDKIPGIDHLNDLIQTAIRPTVGALLVLATTAGAVSPWVAVLLGFAVAGAVHAAKMFARPFATLGSGGLFNPLLSLGEDMIATLAAVAAVFLPLLALGFLLLFAAFAWWVVWRRRQAAAPPISTASLLRR